MKKKSESRYLQNLYSDYEPGAETQEPQILLEQILPFAQAAFQKYEKQHPPTLSERVKSDGSLRLDPSIYTGSGGCIYVYWRIALYFKKLWKDKQFKHYLQNAQKAFEVNLALFQKKTRRAGCASFFMSDIGPLSLGFIIAQESGNQEQQIHCLKKLIEVGDRECYVKQSEDQLLYGNAGYLYALLLVYTHTKDKEHRQELESKIAQLIKQLIKMGRYKQFPHLVYPFPRKQGKLYLGAAHGLVGVIYLLIRAVQIVPNEKLLSEAEYKLIKSTSQFLLSLQFQSGNFPSSLGKSDDLLVHFCHGAPGFIPFLCEAFRFFKDQSYKQAALKAGECVWKKGILKKGNSLCHGIGGNAYMLSAISSICDSEEEKFKWKHRALVFTQLTYDKTLQTKIKKYDSPGRLVQGVPDSPRSLMEGKGGDLCLYADVLSDTRKFPGFEI